MSIQTASRTTKGPFDHSLAAGPTLMCIFVFNLS